jgi:hypothetical protein
MNLKDQANAYQNFFFKSEAGAEFMNFLRNTETGHITAAQLESNLNELNKSAGIAEVSEHITNVIAQVAGQP